MLTDKDMLEIAKDYVLKIEKEVDIPRYRTIISCGNANEIIKHEPKL